jgi:ADP-heptose:LPS heptosyltransferase
VPCVGARLGCMATAIDGRLPEPDPPSLMPEPRTRPTRVCVFARLHEPGLGDLIQRNIFLALLRRAYPQAEVTLVVGSELTRRFADFLAVHTHASRILPAPADGDDDDDEWARFLETMRAERFDCCVVDPDSRGLDAAFAARCGVPVRIGFPTSPAADRWLTAPVRIARPLFGLPDLFDYADGLARVLGLPPLRPADVVPPFPYRAVALDLPPGPLLAVHPGGAKHWNRRWPLDRFARMCVEVAAAAPPSFVLLGAEDESDDLALLQRSVRAGLPGANVLVDAGGSLDQLACLIAAADVLVGNDSAPAHLAAAVGTPSVVLYGPTMTEFMWARAYPRQIGLNRRYACQTIRNLPEGSGPRTMPCAFACHYPYESATGPYARCLTDIEVPEVADAVRRALAGRPPRPR